MNLCDRLGVSFLPASMEIFGNTAAPVLKLINNLSARPFNWTTPDPPILIGLLIPRADVPDTEVLLQDLHDAPLNA